MHHIAAMEEDVGTTANTELDAVPDQVLPIANNRYILDVDTFLWAVASLGATIQRARFSAPTFRKVVLPQLVPLIGAVVPPTNPNIADFRTTPILLPRRQELAVEHTSGVAMGTERHYSVWFLGASLSPAPRGPVYTLRATGATTLVQGTWVSVPLTWDDNLPPGEYDIIGGHVQSATGVAWRLLLANWGLSGQHVEMRPGGLCVTALTNRAPDMQYMGGLGHWGTFSNTTLPRLEVLANAGDTAQVLQLQIVPRLMVER